jgi:uncharacterized surface protein with fasciclin (FAS1) repeats
VKCLRAADLIGTLADTDRSFTLFAPNDRAFKKLYPDGTLHSLLGDKAWLSRTMRYHVLPSAVWSHHFDGHSPQRTLAGPMVVIDTRSGFRVNNADALRPDIECCNGIIHEIDAVLLPPAR